MVKLKKMSFVCCVLALSVLPAFAAPSVRKLGGTGAIAGVSGAVSAKTAVSHTDEPITPRSSSVRSVKTLGTNNNGAIKPASNSNNVNVSRLSVGKYLHSAGVDTGKIKTITNNDIINTEVAEINNQLLELTNRIEVLEQNTRVDVVEQDANADTNKMVNGIDVDTDGRTLKLRRSNVKIPVGSEDGAPVASMWVEE